MDAADWKVVAGAASSQDPRALQEEITKVTTPHQLEPIGSRGPHA